MTTDRRAAPLREYENEDVFAWIRRAGNPVKPVLPTRRSSVEERPVSTGMAAGSNPAAGTHNKKDPINAGATAPGSNAATKEKE